MLIRHLAYAAFGGLLAVGQAQASLITFNATGVAGISGFVQFDDIAFDGSTSQPVPNTFITALMLEVFGETFTLADVSTADFTFVDSSGFFSALPLIVDGSGNLADNGTMAIALYSELFGSVLDGDATLATGPSGGLAGDAFYDVQWVAEIASVPEPATLALLGLGLSALGLSRGRRQATTQA